MAGKKHKHELPIPESVFAGENAAEVLSAWIVDGKLHVAAQRAFEKPEMWGMMLMDFARHAALIYEQQGAMTQRDALMRITGSLGRQIGGQAGMDSGQTTFI